MEKIKVAFVKFAGLASGGTDKFLQIVAANLDKNKFDVTYFYSDTAPYLKSKFLHLGTDATRKEYMINNGVKLIEFHVDAIDDRKRTRDWINTDFWQKFREEEYDIIQTGRAGHPEYPFNKIRKKPIVDSLHLSAGVDNQFNIARVLHLSTGNAKKWIFKGGDKKRIRIISVPVEIITSSQDNLRESLNLTGKFVFGFHQRNNDAIFSPIPLEAYKKIETTETFFILANGSKKYVEQAEKLGIKNFIKLPFLKTQEDIYCFLRTLDVYAHGRKDGEVNSQAMAEAMYFGLPIISHWSEYNNGHVEAIGEAGMVVKDIDAYSQEMQKLITNQEYLEYRKKQAKRRFQDKYDLKTQIKEIENIYEDVIKTPFPNKLHRLLSTLKIKHYFFYGPYKLYKLLTDAKHNI